MEEQEQGREGIPEEDGLDAELDALDLDAAVMEAMMYGGSGGGCSGAACMGVAGGGDGDVSDEDLVLDDCEGGTLAASAVVTVPKLNFASLSALPRGGEPGPMTRRRGGPVVLEEEGECGGDDL